MNHLPKAPSSWFTEPILDQPALQTSLPPEAEIVVIGGGIMGIATAYWLARSGRRVLLLEAHRLAWGTTGRNAGMMLAGSQPLEDPALVQSVLREEGIDAEYAQPGHLALAASEAIWDKIQNEAERRRHTAMPTHALDRAACEDLLDLQINKRFFGGRWWPQGGVLHPLRFAYGLARAAQRHGASFITNTRVLSVTARSGNDRFDLATTQGPLRAQQVVFACHTGLRTLVPAFHPIIQPMRGQVLATEPLPRRFTMGMAVDWGTVYWRQATDGTIVLGGYRSLDPDTETGDEASLNPHIQEALTAFLPEAFPGFPAVRIRQRWAGIMDYATDGKPLIGAMPNQPNQWVIAGFGGHGLPVAIGAGQALAEAVCTGYTPTVLEPYDPARLTPEALPY